MAVACGCKAPEPRCRDTAGRVGPDLDRPVLFEEIKRDSPAPHCTPLETRTRHRRFARRSAQHDSAAFAFSRSAASTPDGRDFDSTPRPRSSCSRSRTWSGIDAHLYTEGRDREKTGGASLRRRPAIAAGIPAPCTPLGTRHRRFRAQHPDSRFVPNRSRERAGSCVVGRDRGPQLAFRVACRACPVPAIPA